MRHIGVASYTAEDKATLERFTHHFCAHSTSSHSDVASATPGRLFSEPDKKTGLAELSSEGSNSINLE